MMFIMSRIMQHCVFVINYPLFIMDHHTNCLIYLHFFSTDLRAPGDQLHVGLHHLLEVLGEAQDVSGFKGVCAHEATLGGHHEVDGSALAKALLAEGSDGHAAQVLLQAVRGGRKATCTDTIFEFR